jgi:hypothetical protein
MPVCFTNRTAALYSAENVLRSVSIAHTLIALFVLERFGQSRVNRTVVGAEANHVIGVFEYADSASYAKASPDPEITGTIDGMRNLTDPPWESLKVALVEKVPI